MDSGEGLHTWITVGLLASVLGLMPLVKAVLAGWPVTGGAWPFPVNVAIGLALSFSGVVLLVVLLRPRGDVPRRDAGR